MNRRTGFWLLATVVGILLLAGIVWAQRGPFTLRRQSIAGGGAAMNSPRFQMRSIGGQPSAAGSASSPNFQLGSGYWGGPLARAATPTSTPTVTPTATATPTPTPMPRPVGGYVMPVSRLELLALRLGPPTLLRASSGQAPWLGLVALASLAALIVALVRRRRA